MSNQFQGVLKKTVRKNPLVLVVDDNEDNLILATASLELFDIAHLVANNGKSALDLAIDKSPDLILLDIVMPELDGIAVARKLKSNPLTSHIRIIAVTGLAYSHQQEEIMDAGCDAYLCKPYLIDDLEDKLTCFINI